MYWIKKLETHHMLRQFYRQLQEPFCIVSPPLEPEDWNDESLSVYRCKIFAVSQTDSLQYKCSQNFTINICNIADYYYEILK